MIVSAEVVQSLEDSNEWIVEALTEEGGIQRTIFIDSSARERAENYAAIMMSQYQLHQRRFEVGSAEGQCANPLRVLK